MSAESVAAVADAYFEAVRGRDVEAIRRLFAPEAELVTAAGVTSGREQIAEFYDKLVFTATELDPHPGHYLIAGDRLAVEIELHMDGNVTRVADLFRIRGSQIVRLGIFNGPSAKATSQ